VHYVNCNFDDNAEGQLMEGLIGKFDIYQSARNRDRVLKAFDEKLSRGEWCWYAPYGYRNASNCNGKIVAIQPEEAENVLYLSRKYASGNYSLETLTKEFENDGRVYKPNQPKLTRSYVADILKKSFYYGMMKYNNRFYPGNYKPIISKELFDRVQEQFKAANKPKKTDRNFAFAGLLTCANCGCAITAELKRKVTKKEKRELRYVYYHCTGNRGHCDIAYVREEVLDKQFADIIKQLVIPDKFSNAIIRTLELTNKDEIDLAQKAVESLSRRKTNLQKKIGNAYEDKLDGKISEEFWLNKTNEWQADLVYVENQLNSRMDSNHNYVEGAKRIIELAKSLYPSYIRQDITEKRKMLKIVLSNLFLNGANIDYNWAEPFNWLVEIPQNEDWRPGLLSQSVLLWDGIRIKMKRAARGKWTIVALKEDLKLGSEPLYSGST